jgi:nitrite reductase (NADH) large subunit
MNSYIIIGNGAAGDTAAAKIRELDVEGSIDVFSIEDIPFYYRPRLMDYMAGEVPFQKLFLHPEGWYREKNIRLHLSTVIDEIRPEKNEVMAADGSVFRYDRLLLAPGADCFVPPIAGIENHGDRIFTVRYKADVDRIVKLAGSSQSLILIGGGLLGLETGNSLRKIGLKLQVVEFFDRLLPRQLDVEGARLLQKSLEARGFEFYLGEVSERLEGRGDILGLHLKSGKILEGNLVIVSAGIRPDLSLATKAGLKTGKGILVDDYLRTSVDNIFAAGDAVEHGGRLYGIWPPAREQGEIAGQNMVAPAMKYGGTVASHKLKVVGIDLLSAGEIDVDGKLESRIHRDEKTYRKAVISEGRLVGCIMLGDTKGEKEVSKALKDRSLYEEVKSVFEGQRVS